MDASDNSYGCCLCRIDAHCQIPYELCAQTRFQALWILSHSSWYFSYFVFFNILKNESVFEPTHFLIIHI